MIVVFLIAVGSLLSTAEAAQSPHSNKSKARSTAALQQQEITQSAGRSAAARAEAEGNLAFNPPSSGPRFEGARLKLQYKLGDLATEALNKIPLEHLGHYSQKARHDAAADVARKARRSKDFGVEFDAGSGELKLGLKVGGGVTVTVGFFELVDNAYEAAIAMHRIFAARDPQPVVAGKIGPAPHLPSELLLHQQKLPEGHVLGK